MKRILVIVLVVLVVLGVVAIAVGASDGGGTYQLSQDGDGSYEFTPYTPLPAPTVTVSVPVPGPTVTVTATPAPTITPSPTPTPTPTAPAGPTVPAGYTLVNGQTVSNLATAGLHHRYYYRCTFTGGSATEAVLSFKGASYNLIFDECTIATGGGWNGVTINDASGRVHDIAFRACTFKAQTRMGFECTSRPTSATLQYQHIDIIGCTFEPMGNEAVSYDGGPAAGNCTFAGNVIQGAGNVAAQQFGAGFEINGPSLFTVTGNLIKQCRGPAFNFQRHVTADCGWIVADNVLDSTQRVQATLQQAASQQVLAVGVYGGKFPRNTVTSSAPGGSVAYISGCVGMDWTTSTWRDATGRASYAIPTQVSGSAANLGL